jgi:D-arabinose 1-dehydrogenase-like Zn-dependent alcohol dehydrogenase
MKAMAIPAFGERLVPIDIPDPEPANGEVTLAVKACGVCRTDLKVWHGQLPQVRRAPLPLVPGHEIVGVVDSMGPDVSGWKVGDRAVVYFYVGCGQCPPCRVGRPTLCYNLRNQIGFTCNGGYAQKVRVPAGNLVRISDRVPDSEAAIIPDAVGTAVHAVLDKAEVQPGDRVLVTGAGGVGLHIIQLVHLSGGFTVVADVDRSKLVMAEELGADEIHLITGLDALPGSIRVNKAIEASGALRDCGHITRVLEPAGRLVIVGYTVGEALKTGALDLVSNEFDVRGSRASNPCNVVTAVQLVEQGKIRPIIDCVFPLGEANEVLSKLSAGELKARAVLVPA